MIEHEVNDFCSRLLRPGSQLVVAVSGGPDSLALLHLMVNNGQFPLTVAHFNHQLRPEAANDAQFVDDTGRRWGLNCVIGRGDVAGLARAKGLSMEEAGRKVRYQFLAQVAHDVGATVVLTGHHGDDQAETVLMHFLRGSGPAGLRGMSPLGPLPGAADLLLARPLLYTGREAILAYCAAHHLQPVLDSSNQDTTFFRNQLRHELLPYLARYNPKISERLQHSAAVLAADYELVEELGRQAWATIVREQTGDWVRVDLNGWRALPLSLRRITLRRAVWLVRASLRDVAFRPVEQARQLLETGQVGAKSTLPGNLTLLIGYDDWLLTAGRQPYFSGPQLPNEEPIPLPVPGRIALQNGWTMTTRQLGHVHLADIWGNRDPWLAYVLGDPAGELWLRPRRPGEHFQPLGLNGHTSRLSEVMINRKIPAGARPLWPIVATSSHLVWLVGHYIDHRVQVEKASWPVLELRLTND